MSDSGSNSTFTAKEFVDRYNWKVVFYESCPHPPTHTHAHTHIESGVSGHWPDSIIIAKKSLEMRPGLAMYHCGLLADVTGCVKLLQGKKFRASDNLRVIMFCMVLQEAMDPLSLKLRLGALIINGLQ